MDELSDKLKRLRALASARGLDAILLQRVDSFAWATAGAAGYVNTARTDAEAVLVITAEGQYLFTNNIEAVRLEKEENLLPQGWQFRSNPWFESPGAVAKFTQGMKLGADGFFPGAVDLSSEIARLRAELTPEEDQRFRSLGRLCAQAMDAAIRSVRPGQSEYEIAALLESETVRLGVQVTVNLIATDERVFRFRHPLPTARKLERYAMLVLCGRRQGLIGSVTRLVHFGRVPDEIRRKAEAAAEVDAVMIAATRPGWELREILQCGIEAYARKGFADEWRLHHQGGPAGYEPREYLATPDSTEKVAVGQVFAWNPSISGVKSEDTILVGKDSNKILTAIPGWPTISVKVDGHVWERPAILEIL